jgi:hypothetical protein
MTPLPENQEIWVRQEVRTKNIPVQSSKLNTKSTRNSGTVDKVRK